MGRMGRIDWKPWIEKVLREMYTIGGTILFPKHLLNVHNCFLLSVYANFSGAKVQLFSRKQNFSNLFLPKCYIISTNTFQ